MSELKEAIAAIFSRASETYDSVGTPMFAHHGRRLVEWAALAPGARVLDIASGRGAVLLPAAEQIGPTGFVTGIDLAPNMVRDLTSEIESRGLRNAEAIHADAEDPPFDDGEFDAILSGFGIFFLPHIDDALIRFRSLLKPGGAFAISTWLGGRDQQLDWYRDIIKPHVKPPPFDPPWENRLWGEPDRLRDFIADAGFADVRTTIEPLDVFFDSAEDYWAWIWSHGGRGPLEQLDAAPLEQVRAEVVARAPEHIGEGGKIKLDAAAIVTLSKAPG